MIRSFSILFAACMVIASAVSASPAVSFRKDVLPILGHHCFKCHGDEKQKGDLNFSRRLGSAAASRARECGKSR